MSVQYHYDGILHLSAEKYTRSGLALRTIMYLRNHAKSRNFSLLWNFILVSGKIQAGDDIVDNFDIELQQTLIRLIDERKWNWGLVRNFINRQFHTSLDQPALKALYRKSKSTQGG